MDQQREDFVRAGLLGGWLTRDEVRRTYVGRDGSVSEIDVTNLSSACKQFPLGRAASIRATCHGCGAPLNSLTACSYCRREN